MPDMAECNFDEKELKLNDLRSQLSGFCDQTRISLVEAQSELDTRRDLQQWLREGADIVTELLKNSLPLNEVQLSEIQKKVVLFKIDVNGLLLSISY